MIGAASSSRQSRLVLCPYGIPDSRRAVCTSILVHCGGDVSRLIDAPAGEQAFLRHLQRLSSMLSAVRPPLVLLTDLLPLMARVVLLRERYEAALAPLRHADWLLYLEHDVSTFVAEALRRGRLERSGNTAVWHGPARMRFLVVSPESDDARELEHGMDLLTRPADYPSDGLPSGPRLPITRKIPRPGLEPSDPAKG